MLLLKEEEVRKSGRGDGLAISGSRNGSAIHLRLSLPNAGSSSTSPSSTTSITTYDLHIKIYHVSRDSHKPARAQPRQCATSSSRRHSALSDPLIVHVAQSLNSDGDTRDRHSALVLSHTLLFLQPPFWFPPHPLVLLTRALHLPTNCCRRYSSQPNSQKMLHFDTDLVFQAELRLQQHGRQWRHKREKMG